MTDPPATPAYRIEDLAHHSRTTVRTIRAYQDKGLLPRPERQGPANLYSDAHLTRLRQIADLLARGYTLASIRELLDAWDTGRGLAGVLGLVTEAEGPWTDEEPVRLSRAELDARFGGTPDDTAVAEAVALGVLEPVDGDPGSFLVPSPQELAVAAELYAAGVPLSAISGHLRELRVQVEHIAARFLEFTTEHVFARYLDDPDHRTDAGAAEGPRSSAGCAPWPSRRWTPNWPVPCACSRPVRCAVDSVRGNSRNPRTRCVPCPFPPTRFRPYDGSLARNASPSSSRSPPNARYGPGGWTSSPHITTLLTILTKHREMPSTCPQLGQFPCG